MNERFSETEKDILRIISQINLLNRKVNFIKNPTERDRISKNLHDLLAELNGDRTKIDSSRIQAIRSTVDNLQKNFEEVFRKENAPTQTNTAEVRSRRTSMNQPEANASTINIQTTLNTIETVRKEFNQLIERASQVNNERIRKDYQDSLATFLNYLQALESSLAQQPEKLEQVQAELVKSNQMKEHFRVQIEGTIESQTKATAASPRNPFIQPTGRTRANAFSQSKSTNEVEMTEMNSAPSERERARTTTYVERQLTEAYRTANSLMEAASARHDSKQVQSIDAVRSEIANLMRGFHQGVRSQEEINLSLSSLNQELNKFKSMAPSQTKPLQAENKSKPDTDHNTRLQCINLVKEIVNHHDKFWRKRGNFRVISQGIRGLKAHLKKRRMPLLPNMTESDRSGQEWRALNKLTADQSSTDPTTFLLFDALNQKNINDSKKLLLMVLEHIKTDEKKQTISVEPVVHSTVEQAAKATPDFEKERLALEGISKQLHKLNEEAMNIVNEESRNLILRKINYFQHIIHDLKANPRLLQSENDVMTKLHDRLSDIAQEIVNLSAQQVAAQQPEVPKTAEKIETAKDLDPVLIEAKEEAHAALQKVANHIQQLQDYAEKLDPEARKAIQEKTETMLKYINNISKAVSAKTDLQELDEMRDVVMPTLQKGIVDIRSHFKHYQEQINHKQQFLVELLARTQQLEKQLDKKSGDEESKAKLRQQINNFRDKLSVPDNEVRQLMTDNLQKDFAQLQSSVDNFKAWQAAKVSSSTMFAQGQQGPTGADRRHMDRVSCLNMLKEIVTKHDEFWNEHTRIRKLPISVHDLRELFNGDDLKKYEGDGRITTSPMTISDNQWRDVQNRITERNPTDDVVKKLCAAINNENIGEAKKQLEALQTEIQTFENERTAKIGVHRR